jgi:hypothetical protein
MELEALDRHIRHLVRDGRLHEALDCADQEIALLRARAATPPAVLALALARKGELLIETGQEYLAFTPLGEAGRIFDELPAEYTGDRARTRAAIARAAGQGDDMAGALVNWRRAADIWRTLPLHDEVRAELAQCLHNAAAVYARFRRPTGALGTQEEAATVVAPLRARRPGLYAVVHATLASYLAGFDPARATALLRDLSPDMATLGGHPEAVAAYAQAATELRQRLPETT